MQLSIKYINQKIFWILLALTFAGATACSSADDTSMPDAPAHNQSEEDVLVLRLSINTSSSSTRTDGNTVDSDVCVNNALVLLFSEKEEERIGDDGKSVTVAVPDVLWKAVAAADISHGAASGQYLMDVRYSKGDGVMPSKLRAVVVANAASLVDRLTSGLSYAESCNLMIQKYTDFSETSIPPRTDAAPFTFWGIAEKSFDTDVRVQSISMKLVRDLSKVNIRLSDELSNLGYSLAGALVYNRNNAVCLMPKLSAIRFSPVVVASDRMAYSVATPSIVSGSGFKSECEIPELWEYSDGKTEWSAFLPEQEVRMDESAPDVSDKNQFSRPALIAGVYFPSSQDKVYWYRLDFKENDSLIDLLRNHSYRISVTSINGPGEDSPREAYYSQTVKADAEIVDWVESDWETAFDGNNWISIPSEIMLGPDADAEGELEFESNVDSSLWKWGWGDSSIGYEDVVFSSVDGPLVSADGNYSVEVVSDTSGRLLFKAFKDNSSEESEACRLYIDVTSRLRLVVTVSRREKSDSGNDHSPWGEQTIPGYL